MTGRYNREQWPDDELFAHSAEPFIHHPIDATIEYGHGTNWTEFTM